MRSNFPRKLRMRLMSLFVLWLWLVFGSPAAAQDAAKAHVRFFNDSAKAATFYVDSQFGCSIPANPEENNAYCDAETAFGEHTLSVKGAELRSQSCKLHVIYAEPGAEAHLSKGERFHCFSFTTSPSIVEVLLSQSTSFHFVQIVGDVKIETLGSERIVCREIALHVDNGSLNPQGGWVP